MIGRVRIRRIEVREMFETISEIILRLTAMSQWIKFEFSPNTTIPIISSHHGIRIIGVYRRTEVTPISEKTLPSPTKPEMHPEGHIPTQLELQMMCPSIDFHCILAFSFHLLQPIDSPGRASCVYALLRHRCCCLQLGRKI